MNCFTNLIYLLENFIFKNNIVYILFCCLYYDYIIINTYFEITLFKYIQNNSVTFNYNIIKS